MIVLFSRWRVKEPLWRRAYAGAGGDGLPAPNRPDPDRLTGLVPDHDGRWSG